MPLGTLGTAPPGRGYPEGMQITRFGPGAIQAGARDVGAGPSWMQQPTIDINNPGLRMEQDANAAAAAAAAAWGGETFSTGGRDFTGVTDYINLNAQGKLDFDPTTGALMGHQSFAPEGWEMSDAFDTPGGRAYVIQGPNGPRTIRGPNSAEDLLTALSAGTLGGSFAGAGQTWSIDNSVTSSWSDIAPGDLYKEFAAAAEDPSTDSGGDGGEYQISEADQTRIDLLTEQNEGFGVTVQSLNARLDEMGRSQGQNDQLAQILMAMQMNPGLQGGGFGGGGGYGYGGYGNAAQYGYV